MTHDDFIKIIQKPGYVVVGETARKLNPQTFGTAAQVQGVIADTVASAGKKRIRQQTGPMLNKTEAAFYEHLKAQWPGAKVLPQSFTLKIGNGVRYTPDFAVITDATNGHPTPVCEFRFYEVKGFMRDDAAVKLKVAASLFPLFGFHLVTKRPKKLGGGWDVQFVLP